jgi:hypothetical protein
MSPWLKLAFPVGLGVVAGFLNYSATQSRIAMDEFVALKQEIQSGESVEESHLKPVLLPVGLGDLQKLAVPWRERSVLVQQIYNRNLMENDLIYWQDTEKVKKTPTQKPDELLIEVALLDKDVSVLHKFLRVGDKIKFALVPTIGDHSPESGEEAAANSKADVQTAVTYIGPFEVRLVGDRVTRNDEQTNHGNERYERIITVAGKFLPQGDQLDAVSSRLYYAAKHLGKEQIIGFTRYFPEGEGDKEEAFLLPAK